MSLWVPFLDVFFLFSGFRKEQHHLGVTHILKGGVLFSERNPDMVWAMTPKAALADVGHDAKNSTG